MSDNTILEAANNVDSKIQELLSMCDHDANEGKVFALVEGQDDVPFYKFYFNTNVVELYAVNSCEFISPILAALSDTERFRDKLFGIRDSDFYKLNLEEMEQRDNLFYTDTHDWETMALQDKSVQRRINIEGSIDDIAFPIVDSVMEEIKPLSYFRLYNQIQIINNGQDGINYKGYSMSAIYDGNHVINLTTCIEHIKSKNTTDKLMPSSEDVMKFASIYAGSSPWQLSRGHDVLKGISVKISAVSGKQDSMGENGIRKLIRMSYSFNSFAKTSLYVNINNWANIRHLSIWSIA